jgi:cytidylate kinase
LFINKQKKGGIISEFMGLLEELVAKHVRRRELLLQDDKKKRVRRKMKVRPFVTISRESGSGGRPIAEAVTKRLGFKLYDKTLIELIAKKAKKRKALIASLDEKDRGFVEDLVHSLLNPDYVSEMAYFKPLCEVVLSVARKGNCVILGRGANFITSQYGGLHVRLAAPFLVRAGYTAQYEGYTIYEARERVKKIDKDRKEFIKQYFGKNPSNANYYDLVVNTTYLQVEEAKDVILTAFRKKFPDWRRFQRRK